MLFLFFFSGDFGLQWTNKIKPTQDKPNADAEQLFPHCERIKR